MRLYYDEITISHKKLLPSGELDINQGDFIVIGGPNGAGKSLLFKSIAYDQRNRALEIAYVHQNNQYIFSSLSVLENITLRMDRDYNEKVRLRMQKDGFGDLLKKQLDKLSGGEKRIVTLLRGLYSSKRVLLLDEPTNDLDYQVVKKIIGLLHESQKDKTLLVISHDSRIKSLANDYYEIRDCRLQRYPVAGEIVEIPGATDGVSFSRSKSEYRSEKEFNVSDFVSRTVKINAISVLLSAIFVLIAGYILWSHAHYKEAQTEMIRDGQVELYSIGSHYGNSKFLNTLFPSAYLSLLNMEDPLKMVRLIRRKDTSDALVLNGLSFFRSENYSIYPLEYYDVAAKRSYSVVKEYLEGEYQISDDEVTLDTSEYFDQPSVNASEEAATYPFDLTRYEYYVERLENQTGISGERLQLSCAVLVFSPEYDRKDFYKTPVFDLLIGSGGYIVYNELSEVVSKVLRLRGALNSFRFILLFSLFMALLNVLYWYLHMKMNKNQVVLLKNYGNDRQTVLECMLRKTNPRVFKVLLCVAFLVYNLWIYAGAPYEQLNYYWVLIVASVMSVMYGIENKIITYAVHAYYRWYI